MIQQVPDQYGGHAETRHEKNPGRGDSAHELILGMSERLDAAHHILERSVSMQLGVEPGSIPEGGASSEMNAPQMVGQAASSEQLAAPKQLAAERIPPRPDGAVDLETARRVVESVVGQSKGGAA